MTVLTDIDFYLVVELILEIFDSYLGLLLPSSWRWKPSTASS